MRKAIIDKNGVLVGAEEKDKLSEGEIDAGDLPTDGKYVYADGRFYPRGHERGKPTAPTVDANKALYLIAKALMNDAPIPQEVKDWTEWYEHYVLERERGR